MSRIPGLRIGDIVRFQRNGQEYEHTGTVVAIHRGCFDVRQYQDDVTTVAIAFDWWEIVAKVDKTSKTPVVAVPDGAANRILDTAEYMDNPPVPQSNHGLTKTRKRART